LFRGCSAQTKKEVTAVATVATHAGMRQLLNAALRCAHYPMGSLGLVVTSFTSWGCERHQLRLRCDENSAANQHLPLSGAELRSVHELRAVRQRSEMPAVSNPTAAPCTGERPTSTVDTCLCPPEASEIAAACIRAATTASVDVAAYWSNSARPYALRGSPYLRPPGSASVWHIMLRCTEGFQANETSSLLITSVQLRGTLERSFMEAEFHCDVVPQQQQQQQQQHSGEKTDTVHRLAEGTAWCIATKAAPGFAGLTVPPIPTTDVDMEQATQRLKASRQQAKRLRVVRPRDCTCSVSFSRLRPPRLQLLGREAWVAAEMAEKLGKPLRLDHMVPERSACCADTGAILAAAVSLGQRAIAEDTQEGHVGTVDTINAEMVPIRPDVSVLLCAQPVEGSRAAMVTGWLGTEAVLKLRVTVR